LYRYSIQPQPEN